MPKLLYQAIFCCVVSFGVCYQWEFEVSEQAARFKHLLCDVDHCHKQCLIQYVETLHTSNSPFNMHPCRGNAPSFFHRLRRHLLLVSLTKWGTVVSESRWQVREGKTLIHHYSIPLLQPVQESTAFKDGFVRYRSTPETRYKSNISVRSTTNECLICVVMFVRRKCLALCTQ
ncbi:unnamed protein product [Ixodes persulcatus]